MTSTIIETGVTLGASVELSILSKATIILVLGLTAGRLASRARASLGHLLLAATFVTILALPLIAALGPGLTLDLPVARAFPGAMRKFYSAR